MYMDPCFKWGGYVELVKAAFWPNANIYLPARFDYKLIYAIMWSGFIVYDGRHLKLA